MRRFVLLLPILALAACGDSGPLKPAVGAELPPRPVLASVTPNADDLLVLPPSARPERIDEIVTRSTPRQPDPFDLAPPEGGAAPQPDPTDVEIDEVDVSDVPGPDVELDDDEE